MNKPTRLANSVTGRISGRRALVVACLILFLILIILAALWTGSNYRYNDFGFNFLTNILAAIIGVILGAIAAIVCAIAVIHPIMRRREEKRLGPLRNKILLFWDVYLTRNTLSILQELDLPEPIAGIVLEMTSPLTFVTDELVNEQELIRLETLLLESDKRDVAHVWNQPIYEDSLRDYKDFLLRMHDTLVALPYLFKETPEVASGVEMLVGNFMSGEKMIEYKTPTENNETTIHLDSLGTAIIELTAQQAFALVRTVRRARLQSH